MINFGRMFNDLEQTIKNNQRKVDINLNLKVYYGLNSEGLYRLSFLSSVEPPRIESTKLLRIVQGKENENVYWTCFDLLTMNAKTVFYSFCADLVNSIEQCSDEKTSLQMIKERFYIWKKMFRKGTGQLTDEKIKGLFGELYFIKFYLIAKYGIDKAIRAWSGPENLNKDFSTENVWYEVKTISSTMTNVKISSVSQLSSSLDGYLIVNKVERMSEVFDAEDSSIEQIVTYILSIISSTSTKDKFLEKLREYGYYLDDESGKVKFEVKSTSNYLVNQKFPRLLESDVKYQEISNVTYELVLNALEEFKGGLF